MNTRSFDTEILSVGTELLLGHVTNTDARDISEMLSKIGINVRYHTVVGDNPERLRKCVEIAKSRADIIITPGGLGPTCDDLTKQILAEAFSLPLVENKAERDGLYDYIKYSRNFTPNNYAQAMLPEGCTVFHNNCGTAPGCAFEKDGKTVIMIPGPPKECRAMFAESALPYLRKLSGGQIVSHSLRIFGIGESAVDQMFRDEMDRMTNPTMAPYAKECDCLLQITAKAGTAAEAENMIRPVMEKAAARLGEYVYGVDVECVEEAVFALMEQNGMTFAAAESCTGGGVAAAITGVSGASEVFAGGAVVYENAAKEKVLGVSGETLRRHGAVSSETAAEMAAGARRLYGVDLAVSLTGIAGPGGGSAEKPVGLVWFGLASAAGVATEKAVFPGSRAEVRAAAVRHALAMLVAAIP